MLLSYVGTELIKTPSNILFWLYLWTNINFVFNLSLFLIITISSIIAVICLFLLISLCIAFRKRHTWFLSDSGSRNPYRLVYKVVSFAREHRNPVRRSAFTYCEDELPSRLDLGKEKYGGPFTTEQVEDVKAFLGILKLLLILGPLFSVERSISFLLPLFFSHIFRIFYSCYFSEAYPSIIIALLLVFYTVLLRPFVHNYIPSMLKCIGLGMMLMLTPVLCFFILDATGHAITKSNSCFTIEVLLGDSGTSAIRLVPIVVSICGYMIFYIAIYEFLYSQSPHSMKGLVIGTFFAIRRTFQLLGILLILFPFLGWKSSSSFSSCGFVYNLISMIVTFFGMATYIWVAKRYQNRQRDEPDNIYQYAEEYYEKAQDEPNYDYDDYDNLDVHTIN